MRRLVPHPVLSLSLVLVWFLLAGVTANTAVLAVIAATLVPLIAAPYLPNGPRLRAPLGLVPYAGIVLWDVVKANIAVAGIILFRRPADIRSAFITVPIDLVSPEAITILACTITLTPGTVTADISADRRSLLIHALHAPDPDAVRDEIKTRYEARLKRIFP